MGWRPSIRTFLVDRSAICPLYARLLAELGRKHSYPFRSSGRRSRTYHSLDAPDFLQGANQYPMKAPNWQLGLRCAQSFVLLWFSMVLVHDAAQPSCDA